MNQCVNPQASATGSHRIAQQMEYNQCLIESSNKVLQTLANEVSKISADGGVTVREMCRKLQTVMDYNMREGRAQLRALAEAEGSVAESLAKPDHDVLPGATTDMLSLQHKASTSQNEWNQDGVLHPNASDE